jgi:tetratricopeptide (TPR) repeat protein
MNEGRKYEELAYTSLKENKIEEAESHFLHALDIMGQSEDAMGKAYVLGNLGNICFQSQRLEMAEDYYSRSLQLMEKFEDVKGIESSLGNLGSVYLYQGSLEKAEDSYNKALEIMVKANDNNGQAVYNEYLGNVFLKRENFETAEDFYSKARKFLEIEKQEERITQLDEKILSIQKHPGYLGNKESGLLKEIEGLAEKGHSRELLDKYQALEDIYFQWARMDKVAEVTKKSIEILETLG